MKSIKINDKHWHRLSTPVPTMTQPSSPISTPTSVGITGWPENAFIQLNRYLRTQWRTIKPWFNNSVLIIPAIVLTLGVIGLILVSIVLTPYGLFQQIAETLFNYLKKLSAEYKNQPGILQKLAVAVTLATVVFVDLIVGLIAAPIFIGRFWLKWLNVAPEKNLIITLLAIPLIWAVALHPVASVLIGIAALALYHNR